MTSRELPLHVLIDWLENWACWCRGSVGARGVDVSDPCSWYQSPERNHHDEPVARLFVRPVYLGPAATVERTIRADDFPSPAAAALTATYIIVPTEMLKRTGMKPQRWDGQRARAARMPIPTYREHLQDAHARLARALWPWRHQLPLVA